MRLTLTGIHSGGRCTTAEKVYVSGGIPGEDVEVVKQRRQGFRCGAVTHVYVPAASRVVPFCPHYSACGGCLWQHIDYAAQKVFKREILSNACAKYGIELPAEGIPLPVGSPLLTGYRNKVEYTFEQYPVPQMGFHKAEEYHTIFDCTQCALLPPRGHELALEIKGAALEAGVPLYGFQGRTGLLRNLLLRTTVAGQWSVTLGFTAFAMEIIDPFMRSLVARFPEVTSWYYSVWEGREEQKYYNPQFVHFAGARYLTEYLTVAPGMAFSFEVSPQAFYQPNPMQAHALAATLREWALAVPKENPAAPIWDLYTGIGTLASVLAVAFPQATVYGIEGNAAAIDDACRNAARNGLTNTQFTVGDILETYTQAYVARYPRPQLVVLDPPRSGTLTEIKKALLAARPEQIIYLSCNPVSLAWDLKQLCEGGYRVQRIRPFDMFPHTPHVETMVSLVPSMSII